MLDQKSILNWQFLVGFLLVVLGGFFLADQFLSFDLFGNYWPLLIVFLGLMFFVSMLLAKKHRAWFAIPGSLITFTGAIFYFHNAYDLWVTWTYAWTLLLSAAGVGMLIMNIYIKRDGLRKAAGWVIGVGLILFVIFGIIFEIIINIAGSNIKSGIFLGSGLVLLGLFVVLNRFIFGDGRRKEKEETVVTEAAQTSNEVLRKTEQEQEKDKKHESEDRIQISNAAEPVIPLGEGIEFDHLIFQGAGEVFINQGDGHVLKIEGSQELAKNVKSSVTDGVLLIEFLPEKKLLDEMEKPVDKTNLKFIITLESIKRIHLSGAGSIFADHLSGGNLAVAHSGGGKVILKGLHYEHLQIALEGVGEIELEGETQTQDVDISGFGRYFAENLKTKETNINVSGAGEARIWVENNLNASLKGAGRIVYKGQPEITKDLSGLGRITAMDQVQ